MKPLLLPVFIWLNQFLLFLDFLPKFKDLVIYRFSLNSHDEIINVSTKPLLEWFRVLALLKGFIFCKVFIYWDVLRVFSGWFQNFSISLHQNSCCYMEPYGQCYRSPGNETPECPFREACAFRCSLKHKSAEWAALDLPSHSQKQMCSLGGSECIF